MSSSTKRGERKKKAMNSTLIVACVSPFGQRRERQEVGRWSARHAREV